MKTDISIRLAVAAVTSVFLFTSCPNPVTTPAKPPAPNYKVQYNYLNPDGSESSTPTNIRVYNTTKDGASQPGHAVARLEQPGIYSILFSDDIGNDDADYIQLFFVSDASMPFRIVNRFTMTDDSGQEVQETVVGIPSRYDTSTQSFDITFSSVQNPSDTLTLQDVVLNKEIFRIKPDGPLGEIEIPIIGGGTMKQYTYPRAHSWLYMDYLLLAGTSVAYAIQHRLQAGESAWSESTYGEGFVAPPSQSGHLTPVFGWNSFWRGVLKVVCTVVAVVAFVVAVVATPAAVVTGQIGYIGWDIFTEYADKGSVHVKYAVLDIIDRLLGNDKTLTTSLPSCGVTSVAVKETENGTQLIHQLVYAIPKVRGGGIEIIEDLPFTPDVTCSLAAPSAPKRVYLAPAMTDLPFSYESGRVTYTVPGFSCSAMVVVEM